MHHKERRNERHAGPVAVDAAKGPNSARRLIASPLSG
jgi:hypothetical protein